MNGRNARKARAEAYGPDGSHRQRARKYTAGTKTVKRYSKDDNGNRLKRGGKPVIVESEQRYHILSAGDKRREYQLRKREITAQC